MLARTGGSEGATEGCGSLLPWHWPCALVVEQLTAALELFGGSFDSTFAKSLPTAGVSAVEPLIENYHARSSVRHTGDVRFPGQPLQSGQSVYGQTRLIPTACAYDRYWHF